MCSKLSKDDDHQTKHISEGKSSVRGRSYSEFDGAELIQ